MAKEQKGKATVGETVAKSLQNAILSANTLPNASRKVKREFQVANNG